MIQRYSEAFTSSMSFLYTPVEINLRYNQLFRSSSRCLPVVSSTFEQVVIRNDIDGGEILYLG